MFQNRILWIALLVLTPAFSLNGFSQTDYYLPQVVAGQNPAGNPGRFFQTHFHLINLSDEAADVEIELRQDDGQPMNVLRIPGVGSGSTGRDFRRGLQISGRGQVTLITLNDPVAQTGWGVVRSSQPLAVVATLQLRSSGLGEVITSTSLTGDPAQEKFSGYALISAERATGFSLINASTSQQAEVRIELYDNQGQFVDWRVVLVQPRGKLAQFLNEGSLFIDRDNFEGTIEVSSSEPLGISFIRVDDIYWSGFPSLPARPR